MSPRIYIYSRYERVWHWLQAVIILALIVTGLEIHAPEYFALTSFETAVSIHRLLGFLLIANAVLGLVYHLASGEMRQYFSYSRDFFPLAYRLGRYYLREIFGDNPHPFEKTPDRKLNPIQRVVYISILNVLLPLQVASGLLLWGAQRWPDTVGTLGGLAGLAAVHTAGSWLFTAYVIMHVYLTTTGRTPTTHIKAMITGWEEKG